ncbi:hypothetical protein GGR57DRAFT_515861 [Xylariaceae sp. FL1272]|nr:hypothetical protein GGR57DRAFT_515861 [Xylariaceae sp. FL1272]
MKLTVAPVVAPVVLTIAAPDPSARNSCGILGVMNFNLADLPANINQSAICQCAEQPLRVTSLRDDGDDHSLLAKRYCYKDSRFGCTNGWCWKTCVPDSGSWDGEWCWTAKNGGMGDWETCSTNTDCSDDMACGEGGCADCGCSCH